MASKIILDLSHFKHIKSDDKTTTLAHKKDGHQITLMHSALNPENQAQLSALSKIPKEYSQSVDKNMADGGEVADNPVADTGVDPNAPAVPTTIQQATTPNLQADMSHFGRVKSMMDSLQISPVDMQNYLNHYNPVGAIGGISTEASEGGQALSQAMGSAEAAEDMAAANAPKPVNPNTPQPGQGVTIEPGNTSGSNLPRDNMNGITKPRPPAPQPNNGTVKGKVFAQGGEVKHYAEGTDSVSADSDPSMTKYSSDLDPSDAGSAPVPAQQAPQPAQNMAPKPPNPAQAQRSPNQATPGLPQMDDVESGINQGFKTQEAGINKAAAAQTAIAGEQAKILDNQIDAQSQAKAAYQDQFDALDQERQAHIQDIQNGYIDPNQYWKGDAQGNGGHSKIAAGIGMILAGFNPTSNPNAAINMVKFQMEQNLEKQKTNLGAKQNLLSANLHQFGNMRDATDMTRMMQNDIVSHQLQAAAAKSGSQMAQAQAMQAIGPLQRENATMQQQFAMRRAFMGLANNPNSNPNAIAQMIGYARVTNPEMAKEMESRYVPGVGMAQIPLPEKTRDELKAHADFDNAAKDLQQWTTTHNTLVPGTKDYNTGLMKARNMQSLVREGQLHTVYREGEQPLLDQQMNSNPANLLKNFNTMPQLRELIRSNNSRLNTLKQSYGLPVQQTQNPAVQQPQIKIINGVKYMRGSDGKAVKVGK